jgi:hypothetical protein
MGVGVYLIIIFVALASIAAEYSNHDCIGQREISSRTCLFQNICFQLATAHFTFFVSPNLTSPFPATTFTSPHINMRSNGLNPFHMTFDISHEVFPDSFAVTSAATNRTHLLLFPYWPENFGHALGDDAFALWRAARAFGLYDDSQLQIVSMKVSETQVCNPNFLIAHHHSPLIFSRTVMNFMVTIHQQLQDHAGATLFQKKPFFSHFLLLIIAPSP